MARKIKGVKFSSEISDDKIKEILASDAKDADDFRRAKAKIRISTMIDTDILDELKIRADKEGDGRYQTYLNQLLRVTLFAADASVGDEQIARVVKRLVKATALKQKRA